MKHFLPAILFLLLLWSSSCGNGNQTGSDEPAADPFRENVMTLRKVGLLKNIPEKTLDSLISIYKNDTLNGLKNLLAYSGDLLKIDISTTNRAPHEAYTKAVAEIGAKYPDLKVDSVRCWYLPSEEGKNDTDMMMMRLQKGDQVYLRKLYYFDSQPVDETFCKVYNDMLAGTKSDTRIFLVTYKCTNCYDEFNDLPVKDDATTMGIIRLTKEQADQLVMPMQDVLALDPVDEFDALSAQEVHTMLGQLEKSGLISARDSGWYRERKAVALENTLYRSENMYTLYNVFDTFFVAVNFDTIDPYPYQNILEHLQKGSRGKFNIGAVSDEPVSPTLRTVRYTLNGQVYEQDYEQKWDMISPLILDDVNRALEEQHIPGAFYTISSRDRVCAVAFIEDEKVEKVKASGFFSEFVKGAPEDMKERYGQTPLK